MIRVALFAILLSVAAPAAAEPLSTINGRLFIDAVVNGNRTQALLDSGAEATLVDRAFATEIGLGAGTPQVIRGSGGSEQAALIEGVTIAALGETLSPEVVVALDLQPLSRRLIRHPTRLIIGRELFDRARWSIDIARGSIARIDKAQAPRGIELTLTSHAGIEAIPARLGGRAVQAEFDLGNGSRVMISRALAGRLGLKRIGREIGGGIGGGKPRDLVRLPTLTLAGRSFRGLVAAVDDQPSANDLNVGVAVLRHYSITTDFAARRIWLEARK